MRALKYFEEIDYADLTGKTSPVLAIQTNLLNKISHPSTIVCLITTNVNKNSEILRVHCSTKILRCISFLSWYLKRSDFIFR